MIDFLSDYDDKTVDELRERLDDLAVVELAEIDRYERQNKNRVTLRDAIESEIRQRPESNRDSPSDSTETENHTGSLADSDAVITDDGQDENPGESDENDREGDDEREGGTVRVRARSRGYFGGLWFDERGVKEVEQSVRIDAALKETDLERVEED
jgi:hypothetical protein